jgi:hypothetical protein
MKLDKKTKAKIKEMQKKKALSNINRLEADLRASKNALVSSGIRKVEVPGWLCAMSVVFSIVLGLACSFIWQVSQR